MRSAFQLQKIWPTVVKVGVVLTLAVALAKLVDIRNEVAELKTELSLVKTQREEMKSKNDRLFTLVVSLVKDGSLALDILRPFVTSVEASEITQEASKKQKGQLPFWVGIKFYPSGWMGDGEYGEKYVGFKRRAGSVKGFDTTVIQLSYRKGPKGWAGIYWQYPDGNWGTHMGRNLLGASKITFFAKGAQGGEIVEFKSGGIRGRYKDSYEVSLGKVVLKKNWEKYTIVLSASDLSTVIGVFAWVVTAADNESDEITTYISEPKVE